METIEADYVVVGAGSAGCVVAARLTERSGTSVVLLEAGGADRNPWIHIPLGYGKTIADPRVNWCYETEPDPGLNDRRVFWPRGKVLGGSSSINGLLYVRGQAGGFRSLAPARQRRLVVRRRAAVFQALGTAHHERQQRRTARQRRPARDLRPHRAPPLCEAYIAASEQVGIPRNDDFNGEVQEGVGYYQVTARNGRRCSAAVAFLRPAMKRPNLRLVMHAHAERVLFAGRRATGVVFRRGAERVTVRARREVILCGGAINSPQLLMLSGRRAGRASAAARYRGAPRTARRRAQPAGPLSRPASPIAASSRSPSTT